MNLVVLTKFPVFRTFSYKFAAKSMINSGKQKSKYVFPGWLKGFILSKDVVRR